jgi:transcriptional regulator CtsR
MAVLSDIIEDFIKEMLDESEKDFLEIQRNELANHFGCAPSQINYVLTTRFTVDKGYHIVSRRGGGGSIKITKVSLDPDEYFIKLVFDKIGDTISQNSAESYIDCFLENELVTNRESEIMKAAMNDKVLTIEPQDRDYIRANILKSMILMLVNL